VTFDPYQALILAVSIRCIFLSPYLGRNEAVDGEVHIRPPFEVLSF